MFFLFTPSLKCFEVFGLKFPRLPIFHLAPRPWCSMYRYRLFPQIVISQFGSALRLPVPPFSISTALKPSLLPVSQFSRPRLHNPCTSLHYGPTPPTRPCFPHAWSQVWVTVDARFFCRDVTLSPDFSQLFSWPFPSLPQKSQHWGVILFFRCVFGVPFDRFASFPGSFSQHFSFSPLSVGLHRP